MKYITLRSTGPEVSRITFGCWELGGGQWEKEADEVNIEAIQVAFDLGITSLDTAEGYGKGHSEEIVGMALEGKRKQCFIATKVSREHLRPEDIRTSVENSLRRLRTDYLDIYYVHWPNPEIPIVETMNEFRRLKEEGIIRAIGVSNFSIDQLKEAMTVAPVDVIQPEYSLLHRSIEKEIIPYCIEHDIHIFSYSSIAKGILTGVYHNGQAQVKDADFRRTRRLFLPEHMEKERELIDLLREIADRHGVSLSEVAICWLLQQRGLTSAIVGSQNLKHVRTNVQAAHLDLSDGELQALRDISSKVLVSIDGSF